MPLQQLDARPVGVGEEHEGDVGRLAFEPRTRVRQSSAAGREEPGLGLDDVVDLEREMREPPLVPGVRRLAVHRGHEARAVLAVLREAASRVGQDVAVEIADVDPGHVRYRIAATLSGLEERSVLLATALGALYAAGLDGGGVPAPRRE